MKRLLATLSMGEGADVADAVGSATRKEKQVGGKLKGTTGGGGGNEYSWAGRKLGDMERWRG